MIDRVAQVWAGRMGWRIVRAGLVRVLGIGCLFLVEVVLARVLGAESYGVYAYVISWLAILVVFGRFGMDGATLRFAAAYRAAAAWPRLTALLRESFAIIVVASLVVGFGIWVVATVWMEQSEVRRAFMVGGIALPLMALSSWATHVLLAADRAERAIALDKIVRATIMVLALLGVAAWGPEEPTGEVALLVLSGATLASLAVAVIWIQRAYPREAFRATPRSEKREWLRVAFALMLVANLQMVIARTDVVMIGAVVDPTQAGVYRAASRIADLVVFGLTSVGLVVGPTISRLHHADDLAGLRKLLIGAWRLSVAITLPLGLGVALASNQALALFGVGFSAGRMPLLVLTAGQVFNGLCGPVGMVLTMTGRHVAMAWILGITAVLNVAFNALWIPRFGMMGAAAATGAATVFWNLAAIGWIVKRGLGGDSRGRGEQGR